MNIEIVEFYPKKRGKMMEGTLHVYLIDHDIDLRGIMYKHGKKDNFVLLPTRKAIDEETKEEVKYPVFNFTDREKNRELIQEIKKQAWDYVNKNFRKKKG